MKKINVNFRLTIICSILSIFLCSELRADRIIGYYFEPYPGDQEHAEKLSNKLQKPGKVAKCLLEGYACYSPVAGIFSTYAGYIAQSDVNGFTAFPRKQDNASLNVIITPVVTPIFMFTNTVHHWQIEQANPVASYLIERKRDKETQLYFWEVSEKPNPEDYIIPIESLLIIADPKNIVVPTGITMTTNTPNLILPPMYVKKGMQTTKHALYVLNLNYLFGQVKKQTKKKKRRLSTLIS